MSANFDGSSYEPSNIYRCRRCGGTYDWRRSLSTALKMTYCGTLCEVADLGATIDELIRVLESMPARAERSAPETLLVPKVPSAA